MIPLCKCPSLHSWISGESCGHEVLGSKPVVVVLFFFFLTRIVAAVSNQRNTVLAHVHIQYCTTRYAFYIKETSQKNLQRFVL